MKNIALLGFGTVGKGCAEILKKREKEITTLLGEKIQIKKILVRNKTKDRGEDYSPLLADNFNEILNDPITPEPDRRSSTGKTSSTRRIIISVFRN